MNKVRICIIKLGALGDVVRTTPILPAIKEKYSQSEITWITKQDSFDILEGNPNIDEIITLPLKPNSQEFDILYNFDIDEEATKLALTVKAKKKYGYYDNGGFPASFNPSAEYYLNTVFDDHLKKSNKKTYQEMIFETAELNFKQQKPFLHISKEAKEYAEGFLKQNNIGKGKIIGLNIGASKRWPSKSWSIGKIREFTEKITKKGYHIILLGGESEKTQINELISEFAKNNVKIYNGNTRNSLKNFFAMINICDKVICADTLALHVALAFGKETIALFFVTSPHEIEGYNLLTKLISPLLDDFFPERSDEYHWDLVNSISVQDVLEAVEKGRFEKNKQ